MKMEELMDELRNEAELKKIRGYDKFVFYKVETKNIIVKETSDKQRCSEQTTTKEAVGDINRKALFKAILTRRVWSMKAN
jgi:hypothetical protein